MEGKTSTPKKAVLYCRVSTKEQADEGNSLITQERAGNEWAARNGYEILKTFVERGESAKTADRPKLGEMMKYCANHRKNGVQAVIIYKLDRLSRNTDDYSQIRLLLRRYGVEIKSITEFFEDTPAGRFMENIIANVAQFDNDVRAERCAGGMREAVRDGRYVWMAPIGYDNVRVSGKATIAANDMGMLVRQAFELVASGLHSTEEVWRIMCERGLRKKNGCPLTNNYFRELLKNPIYTGWINKFGERHKGAFESVVSDELFARVQYMLKAKGHKVKQYVSDSPDFPLRRFITDLNGVKLTGSFSRGRNALYPYYRFGSSKESHPRDEFERLFMDTMDSYRFRKEEFGNLATGLKRAFDDRFTNERKTSAKLQSLLVQLDEQEGALVRKNLAGVIGDNLARRELERVERIRNESLAELSMLKNLHAIPDDALEFAGEYLMAPSSIWRKSVVGIQLKLQWFQFPSGLVFDGKKFGTAEVSCLFKEKSALAAAFSANVDYRLKIWNQLILEIQSVVEILNGYGIQK